jgi:two-component system, NtrC family, nitrogen regulation sensor histidine kinase NtrY
VKSLALCFYRNAFAANSCIMATIEADLINQQTRPAIRRLGSRVMDWFSQSDRIWLLELVSVGALLMMAIVTSVMLIGQSPKSEPLSPTAAAALLVANLVPATTIIMLLGRRLALRRSPTGGGQLHIRLVAIFSLLAAVPALLLAIFASVLFQSGVQFWSSDSARGMLENAGALAKGYYRENISEVSEETKTMAIDLNDYLDQTTPQDPRFMQAYIYQVLNRKLTESAIVSISTAGAQETVAVVSPDDGRAGNWLSAAMLERLKKGAPVAFNITSDRIEAVTPLAGRNATYVYASRAISVPSFSMGEKAQSVLEEYTDMVARSRNLQFQFNSLLYFVSLIITGVAVWIALLVADRLVRPVNDLVVAAQRISEGDLSARVKQDSIQNDEVGFLARSFNTMTERLESQTGNLMNVNRQLDDRRSFIETILESVSAAVLSTSADGTIRLANGVAEKLLGVSQGDLAGQGLKSAAPFLADLIDQSRNQAIVQLGDGTEPQTLAVRISPLDDGYVITFEDITQQLTDQRQAAWADVARRIAHEIKNPLTPIQLAAERLQRRFSKQIDDGQGVFSQLTSTIVRQVGDLRNIVDEFSSFARMPKPVFRDESLSDIVGHSVFLFQVAHQDIIFEFQTPETASGLLCDRRQIGQAITNILKNAAEAIEARRQQEPLEKGNINIAILETDGQINIAVRDNGIGLPESKERLVEPYVTTRASGSGLGLAIVKKIVEEHHGELLFEDAPDRGAKVTLRFFPERILLASGIAPPAQTKSKKNKDKV